MLILKKDFREVTRLKPQSLDDIWALRHILQEGDIIGVHTMRTIAAEKREKAPTFLKMRVEKIEFDENGNLRIGGEITAAPEKIARGWHAVTIAPGEAIGIEKPAGWQEHQKRRLNEAAKYRVVEVLICVLDDKIADFALATELKIKAIATIRNRAGGKRGAKEFDVGVYFKEITDFLSEQLGKVDRIIIAGPGFTKENLIAKLPDEIKLKVSSEHASVTGETGLNEVVRRGALDKIIAGTRLSKETELVEKFLLGLAKSSPLVIYSKDKVKAAAETGAIETLLVSDKLMKEKGIEALLLKVEEMRGVAFIVNSTHEAGEKLLGLGGLGAFLRFKTSRD